MNIFIFFKKKTIQRITLAFSVVFLLSFCQTKPEEVLEEESDLTKSVTPSEVRTIVTDVSVNISWQEVEDASYKLYQAEETFEGKESPEEFKGLAGYKDYSTKQTSYIVTGLSSAKTYYFTVTALMDGNEESLPSEEKVVKLNSTFIYPYLNSDSIYNPYTLAWNKISDVDYYEVYFANESMLSLSNITTGYHNLVGGQRISQLKTNSLVLSNYDPNKDYYFIVAAKKKDGNLLMSAQLLRTSYYDINAVFNEYSGFYSSPWMNIELRNHIVLNGNRLESWGNVVGNVPTGNEFIKVYPGNPSAALKFDGSISVWGNPEIGGANHDDPTSDTYTNAPAESGYKSIHRSNTNLAAIKALDGSISVWGNRDYLAGAPTDNGYIRIYTSHYDFVAVKSNGIISAWGLNMNFGNVPTDNNFIAITPNNSGFAALKPDGSIKVWGGIAGLIDVPTDNGYVRIFATNAAFAALKADGTITAWGPPSRGGVGEPTDDGYVDIKTNEHAFAAIKANGSITAWGGSEYGGVGAPTDSGYVKVYSRLLGFAAMKADGSIYEWGGSINGNYINAPSDTGYEAIASSASGFAALKDGKITVWGDGVSGAPTDSGYVRIYSNNSTFAALKNDGSITTWGGINIGGNPKSAPKGVGYRFNNSP